MLVGDVVVTESTGLLSEYVQTSNEFTTKNYHTIAQELAELAIKVAKLMWDIGVIRTSAFISAYMADLDVASEIM